MRKFSVHLSILLVIIAAYSCQNISGNRNLMMARASYLSPLENQLHIIADIVPVEELVLNKSITDDYDYELTRRGNIDISYVPEDGYIQVGHGDSHFFIRHIEEWGQNVFLLVNVLLTLSLIFAAVALIIAREKLFGLYFAATLSIIILANLLVEEHRVNSKYYPKLFSNRDISNLIGEGDDGGEIAKELKIYEGDSEFLGFDFAIFRIDRATYVYHAAAELSQVKELTAHAEIDELADGYFLAHYPAIKRGVLLRLLPIPLYPLINLLGWGAIFFAMLWVSGRRLFTKIRRKK